MFRSILNEDRVCTNLEFFYHLKHLFACGNFQWLALLGPSIASFCYCFYLAYIDRPHPDASHMGLPDQHIEIVGLQNLQ